MHGLTIDHLVQATVVSADAITRTANSDQNSDLFWGIRGGGMNFGVVTEFVFQLHPQQKTVFAGPIVFTREKLDSIAQTIDKWYPTAGTKEAMHCIFTRREGMVSSNAIITFTVHLCRDTCIACDNAVDFLQRL